MSATLKNIYAPTPVTTRGKPTVLSGDPKGNNFLYTCGNSVIIRNIKNPLICDIYYEHQAATTVAKYAPSGFYIASGDVTGTLRIWDTTQQEHPLKIELKILSSAIYDIAWSPDNQRLVVVGDGKERFGAAILWDSGASVGEITGHSKPIISVDFKPSRPFRVATGSEDFQVNWFEGPPFKFKQAMKDHTRFVNVVRFSPDGNKLVTAALDKKVFVLDGKSGEKVRELGPGDAHGLGIYGASWSPDNKHLLTVSADKTAKIWDTDSGNVVKTFVLGTDKVEHQQLGCLWQGDHLVTVNLNGDLTFLDPNNPEKPLAVQRGHNKLITALAFDSTTKQLFSGSYDATIVQWDVATGRTLPLEGKGHGNQITAIAVHGNHLFTISMDDSLRITPLNTREYGPSIGLDSPPAALSVGPSGVVVVATMKSVVVVRNGKVVSATAAAYQPTAIGLSPNEKEVIVGGKDNSVHVYELQGDNVKEVGKLEGHRGSLTSVVVSPDGKLVASADANREIIIWDIATRQRKVDGWVFHAARVTSLSWHPSSKYVASGAIDSNLYVWNVVDHNKRVFIRGAHHGGVSNCAWVDDKVLASAGQDCSIKTWNINF